VDTAIAVSVQLSSFTASAEKRYVALNWSLTQTSDPAAFNVWRATADGEFTRVTSSPVTAPTLEFAWIDIAVTPGITYQYKIQALDTRGNSTMFGPVSVTVALPRMLSIDQNIPNPFNPTTSIGYQVPWSADVRLVIHNILGQEVVTLVDAPRSSGFYRVTWHGRTGVGTEAGSGVYFARLVATPTDGARSESRIIRMMLVK